VTSIVLYFHVHQPFRLRRYTFFDIARDPLYFDDDANGKIVRRVAERCYLPMNALLMRLFEKHGEHFKCAMSITSTALEQFERWCPEALDSFLALARTGCVEFVSETSHHSLAFLSCESEFRAQVRDHTDRLERTFGVRPRSFRNTELVIDDRVTKVADDLGFVALLGEGADHLIGWRSPMSVYGAKGTERLKVLLRNYRFSDDIAFRFSNRGWEEWPLSAEKFARWVADVPPEARQVGLFMDYETIGEHQWEETGIFDFMEHMPAALLKHPRFAFRTPSEVADLEPPTEMLEVPHPVSWADAERDLSAWLGNPMQRAAHEALYEVYPDVRRAADAGRPELLERWRKLSTSDHVYYMCTKGASDGEVHAHFSPYEGPHEAYVMFMNVLDDLARRARAPHLTGAVPD
jgi:alpha-amylase